MPTSPSGATTGLNCRMPASAPRVRVIVNSSPRARLWSASAGTKPHPRAWPSPNAARSRSFSASSSGTRRARMTTLSCAAVWASCRTSAVRPSSASRCRAISGAMNVRRSPRCKRVAQVGRQRERGEREESGNRQEGHVRAGPAGDGARHGSAHTLKAQLLRDRPVLVLVVENPSGPANDTRERVLVDVDRQARFLAEQQIQARGSARRRPS